MSPTACRGTLVVPAHDEERRGFAVLGVLVDAASALGVQPIVVCNGCTDNTVELARSAAGVTVVELAHASKTAALNEGDAVAGTCFPRLYLDADIQLSVAGIASLLGALDVEPARLVAPRATFLLDGAPWLVRRYYGAMGEVPFLVRVRAAHLEGRGVYGLNAAGRARFDTFPDVVADDAFVDRMFDPGEKLVVADVSVGVPVPEEVSTFLRSKSRTSSGSRELAAWLAAERPDRLRVSDELPDPSDSFAHRAAHHLRRGGLLASLRWRAVTGLAVYLGVEALGRTGAAITVRRGRRAPWR